MFLTSIRQSGWIVLQTDEIMTISVTIKGNTLLRPCQSVSQSLGFKFLTQSSLFSLVPGTFKSFMPLFRSQLHHLLRYYLSSVIPCTWPYQRSCFLLSTFIMSRILSILTLSKRNIWADLRKKSIYISKVFFFWISFYCHTSEPYSIILLKIVL